MAADLLSMVGISSKPDPNLYKNQQEVSKQTDEVKNQLKGTIGSIDLALSAASLAGIPTDSIESLQKQANDLVNNTSLTPDQIEKRRKQIESDLAAAQKTQKVDNYTKRIADLSGAATEIDTRVEEIKKDKNVREKVYQKYIQLQRRVKEDLEKLRKAAIETPNVVPDASYITAEEALKQLDALNNEKDPSENSWRKTLKEVRYGLMISFVCIAAFFAGIIAANMYAEESFWGLKAFYFVYGAGFFPLPLLYACFKPPVWYSGLLPMYLIERPVVMKDLSGVIVAGKPARFVDTLFGYYPHTPDDMKDPTVANGKFYLRMIAIVNSIIVGLLAYFFDFMKYLKKGG